MICGLCNENHGIYNDCSVIQSIKKKLDDALIGIQKSFNNGQAIINENMVVIKDSHNDLLDRVKAIESKLNKHKTIHDLKGNDCGEVYIEPTFMYSWPTEARKQSQKHLEKCLREKNERIKTLEEHLTKRNHECQNALNSYNNTKEECKAWKREYDAAVERNSNLVDEIRSLKSQMKKMSDYHEKLANEHNRLRAEYNNIRLK